MPNSLPLFHVDAFATKPFTGNPAAVCLLSEPRDELWMQQVGQEMNLSETAFLLPEADGYRLRWFAPQVEIALCGHATLASAHILWEQGLLQPDTPAVFHTKSGILTAEKEGGQIRLDFPATPPSPCPPPTGLTAALGASFRYVGKSRFDYLLELDSEETVRKLKPDYAQLVKLPVRGVIVTAKATASGFDFVTRFFAPATGVPEDPATGSAHCCLAPYWSEKLGKRELTGLQVSQRTGVIGVRLVGDRVHLIGKAITIARGELIV